MKIHIIFYKYIPNITNGKDVQHSYLSIKPLLNLLATVFVEKMRFLSIFFSNSEFGMRVHRGEMEARNKGIFLHTFLRISPRKINILKKTKLVPRQLNEVDDVNVKKMLLNLPNILKSTTKVPKKWNKKGMFRILSYLNMSEHFKTRKFHYQKVSV